MTYRLSDKDLAYMKMAISLSIDSRHEDDRPHPKVGVVVVKGGKILATAYRGEIALGDHAEFTALEKKLNNTIVSRAVVYTTLEPCTTRNHPKIPCVQRLIDRKVSRVCIGMLDPNPKIRGDGLMRLREANIEVNLFPVNLMAEIEDINRDFIRICRTENITEFDQNDTVQKYGELSLTGTWCACWQHDTEKPEEYEIGSMTLNQAEDRVSGLMYCGDKRWPFKGNFKHGIIECEFKQRCSDGSFKLNLPDEGKNWDRLEGVWSGLSVPGGKKKDVLRLNFFAARGDYWFC